VVENIRYRDELTAETLWQLALGDIDLIHHRGYYDPKLCEAVLPAVIDACAAAQFDLTKEFTSVGVSMGQVAAGGDNVQRYLDTATATTRMIRQQIFAGLACPTDQLRLELDEMWPAGAMVARHEGRAMLPGVLRRMTPGGRGSPHMDRCGIPLLDRYRLTRRLGVNVYLEVPPPGEGGETDFWGRVGEAEFVAMKADPADYGLDPDLLGPPWHSLLPEQGDLAIFDAGRLHGVREVRSGYRTSSASFVGVRGPADPLVLFA
jgi:hypothetical protein